MSDLPAVKTAVVLPTIRQASLERFLAEWDGKLPECRVIVVEDNPQRTFPIDREHWWHFCHEDIDRDLAGDAWIIPRKTDCVRSYGYLKALEMGAEVILTLDDDCYPSADYPNPLRTHLEQLESPGASECWFSTCTNFKPRGYPYYATARSLPVAINHGLWEGVPDFDAPTQLLHSRLHFTPGWVDAIVPKGSFFPMCGMNLSFRRDIAPCFYFLLMGTVYPFDRFGDIWCGIFAKKICDHLGWGVRTGPPAIHHSRASDVWKNLAKETPGLEWNERLWVAVDSVVLTGNDVATCYAQVADAVKGLDHPYFEKLATAMRVWARLAQASVRKGQGARW